MIIITGASGFLGSEILYTFNNRFNDVIGTYNKNEIKLANVKKYKIDLSNLSEVKKFILKYEPQTIIHCAAITDVDYCQKKSDLSYRNNVLPTKYLIDSINNLECKLLYISTDSVFNGIKGRYVEEDKPSPVNIYASHKFEAEKLIQLKLSDYIIIRTNFFGDSRNGKNTLSSWVINELVNNKIINGFSDVLFNPLYVKYISYMLIDILKLNLKGIFHLGSSNVYSKYEFILKIADLFSLNSNLVKKSVLDDAQFFAPRPRNTTLDVNKTEKALHTTMPTIEEMLKEYKSAS